MKYAAFLIIFLLSISTVAHASEIIPYSNDQWDFASSDGLTIKDGNDLTSTYWTDYSATSNGFYRTASPNGLTFNLSTSGVNAVASLHNMKIDSDAGIYVPYSSLSYSGVLPSTTYQDFVRVGLSINWNDGINNRELFVTRRFTGQHESGFYSNYYSAYKNGNTYLKEQFMLTSDTSGFFYFLRDGDSFQMGVADDSLAPYFTLQTSITDFSSNVSIGLFVTNGMHAGFDQGSTELSVELGDFESYGVSEVPVPGAVWLLGSGLLGLFGIRRKMKS